jgi:hypothetical protein
MWQREASSEAFSFDIVSWNSHELRRDRWRETMKSIRFDKNEDVCELRLAKFLAQLVREGIVYKIKQDAFEYEVELTGF